MKKLLNYFTLLLFTVSLSTNFVHAQTVKLGDKLKNVQIRDANDKPINLPGYGKHPLLIFYPDPDHSSCKFTDYLEEHPIGGNKLMAYGIVNLKDAPLMPNSVIRAVIRSKIKKTGAAIYTDPNHLLRNAWNLGDCNNKFVFIIIDTDGTLLYLHKGEPSEADIKRFYQVVNKIK